jgi:2-polyprenyl-3-methyl-5-hydroxy-6-metoxy-1,4-benzoquinol methylase
MSQQMFDATASNFAKIIDNSLASGNYVRGRLFIDALVKHLPPGARLLDFGCGPGRLALLAARAGFEVEGFDRSSGMVEEAKKQNLEGARISFGLCDGIGDDLESGRYDGVMCSSVIEYVVNPDNLLANFARAIKLGGLLVITYSNKLSLWRAYVRLMLGHLPHHAHQINIWTFAETRRRLEANHFKIVEGPVFLEADPFDKRGLHILSSSPLVGTLGFVVARRV